MKNVCFRLLPMILLAVMVSQNAVLGQGFVSNPNTLFETRQGQRPACRKPVSLKSKSS